jgi:tripartite-type tricarboxylate transporter receptor subunit TctC
LGSRQKRENTMKDFRLRLRGMAAFAFVMPFGVAHAQNPASAVYPAKPIRLIVPFAAGGPVDIIARGIAPRMSEILRQQIIVDNRGGAGSTIGTELVAVAPPDGYTLVLVSGSFVMNPAMIKKLPYDSLKDFAPISIIAEIPTGLSINPALPARDLKAFVALAKARPGELNYASPGRGTVGHLTAEWFSAVAGVRMVHVPYKGAAPATVDLVAGQVQLLFAAVPGMIQFVRDGKVRMLAQGGKTRSSSLPQVPTFVESGMPGFILTSNFGLLAPAATPRPVIQRLHGALVEALTDPVVSNRLASQGADKVASTPEEQAATIKAEIAKWAKVAAAAGIQPE